MGLREDEATLREAARQGKLKYKVVDTGGDRASRPAGSVNRYHIVDSEGRFAGSASNQTYAKELSAMLQNGRERPAHLSPGGSQVALVDHYASQGTKPAAAPAAATRPKTLGKLEVVKQSNGKFVIVNQASGGVLHSKAGKTSSGRALPAAPMEFGSKELAAGTIKDMRTKYEKNSRYNPSFVKTEVAPAANAAGELPVTFDPKDVQGKSVKFFADEAYDKGYRVIDRGADVPAAERYGFKNPAGVESNKTFATPRLAQDAMVKNRGTTPDYGKPPKFEGADYEPPKPEPVKAEPVAEPVKTEPVKTEPVKPTSTAKPKASAPEPAGLIDGPNKGVGPEAVLKDGMVEFRQNGKVIGTQPYSGEKYYLSRSVSEMRPGLEWNPMDTPNKSYEVKGRTIIDLHQIDPKTGTWARVGEKAAQDLGHPVVGQVPTAPAPVVEPVATPVTPASVVEDAVNKGKAARGEATIPVTEGTAMPKNPKPLGEPTKVVDRGPEFQRNRRFVVQDKAGNILFEGNEKAANAAVERIKAPGTAIKPQALPEGALPKIRAANQAVALQQADDMAAFVRNLEINPQLQIGPLRKQLVAQAQAQRQAQAGALPFQMTPNVPPMTGPAPAPVLPAGASSPVSYPASGPFENGGLKRLGEMKAVMRAPQPAPLVPQQMVPFQTTPFSGAPSVPVSPASAAADAAIAGATKGAAPFDAAEAWKAAHAVPETVGSNLRFATKAGTNELSKLGKAQKWFAGAPVTGAIPRMTAGLPSALKWAPKTALGNIGLGVVGNVVGNIAGDALDKSNWLGGADSRANDAVSAAIRGAGLGVGLGAVIPGIGAPLGALGGAAIGGLWNYMSNKKDQAGTQGGFSLDQLQAKYGIDPDILANIKNDYSLRMDMAETEADRTTARNTARAEFQNAAMSSSRGLNMAGSSDALALQAMIGNYVKPYADMYKSLDYEVANAYDQVAKSMGGPLANVARLGGAQSRAFGEQQAGALMGAAMIDPFMATQQKQAGQLAQIEQQMLAQQMAGLSGDSTNLLGGG